MCRKLLFKKDNFCLILLAVVVLITIYFQIKSKIKSDFLREQIPCLLIDEKVGDFMVISAKSTAGPETLDLKDGMLLFVFSRPCSSCEKNIPFWNAIAELCDNVIIKGVIIDGNLTQQPENINIAFDIVSPSSQDDFMKKFHIRTNHAQTILIRNHRVEFIRMGILEESDLNEIVKRCGTT